MKRLTVIAVAIAAVMFCAIPAMAVDVDFSGSYYVRGFYADNTDLNDNSGASDAFMDMRLRLQTVFQVNDTLKLTTRFDAMDGREWGTADDGANPNKDNIDFDRAYLTANFDMFDLDVGRMSIGTYGTTFLDSGSDGDRIKLVKNMDPYTLMFIYQKSTEADAVSGSGAADEDKDVYLASVKYKDEGVDTGILIGYTSDKTDSSFDRTYCSFNPYVRTSIGPVNLVGELGWITGDYIDSPATQEDYSAVAYHLNASGDVGPAGVSLGYAFSSGDVNTTDNDHENYPLATDWQPLLILTGRTAAASSKHVFDLGGAGNFNSENMTGTYGYKIYYGTVAFSPMENVTLNGIIGVANADEVATGWDDDAGTEYDIGVTVKLMDNLTYKATLGYLDAGDFWKQGTPATVVDNTYMLFHQLTVTF